MRQSLNSLEKYKRRAALFSLGIGAAMLILKLTAYIITGSAAIFSDAAESIVHILATSMAFYSIVLSAKPADESHLYGHGNIEFFSAGLEGLLIVLAAVVIIYESVNDIIHGSNLKSLDTGVLIVAGAGVVNLFLGLFLIKAGKKANSITLSADGKHVLTDSFTSLGVVIGILLVMLTELEIFDPLFAIGVAINIIYTGYRLIRESIGGLMNETDLLILDSIIKKIDDMKKDYWIDIHHLRFWKSGDKIFIDFHLILPYYFNIKESHLEEEKIASALLEVVPNSQIKIHMDYCNYDLCKYCDYQTCAVRKEVKSVPFKWNKEKLIGGPIYAESHIS